MTTEINRSQERTGMMDNEDKGGDAQPMIFSNGLSPEEDDAIDDVIMAIVDLKLRIETLGRHRSYSLAVTKLDEAQHWMRDRKGRPAA